VDPRMTVLSVDAAGAYDHVSRGAMLRALHARPDHSDLQALLPYARWSYATASSYTCAIARGECHAIVQAEGGEQGDPLLPGLYSLAAHPALHDVQACLREREAVFAYLDDTYFVAAPKRIRELYAIVEDALWRHARVRLNAAKTQIWNAVGDEPADIRGLQADGGDPVWRLGFATRAMAANDDRVTLESFDGTDVAAYRKWKGVHNCEAELVCESIPVDKLCKEDGDQLVFALPDEKFGPQPTDLLHAALKEFFYELYVKNGETYQNFQARFFHANQKLEEQEVKLLAKVLGFMMVKKLRLDPTQESLLLTATKGSMDYKDVVAAVKFVFPEGKGASGKQSKEVFFTATADESPDDENEDFQDAMAAVEDMQAQDLDEEDILDAYESYVEIRRRMAEKKKARGFTSSSSEAPKWRLTGTVNGRIEQLKAKTRCHLCHKVGHWRKECPLRGKNAGAGKGSRAAASSSSARASEANLVEETSDVFITEEGEAKDLLKHSHSTGNRQRLACENGVFERWRHGRSIRDDGESPVVIASSPLAFQGALQEVLSADAQEGQVEFQEGKMVASDCLESVLQSCVVSGATAEEIVGGTKALDTAPDSEADEVTEINGKTMTTSYVGWLRGHGAKSDLTDPLMQLKAYIAHRDCNKFNRLAAVMISEKATPKAVTFGRMSSPPKRRIEKQPDRLIGDPMQTEVDETLWIRVGENPRLVRKWEDIVEQKMVKHTEQKRVMVNRVHRDQMRVQMLVEAVMR
ncbi:unnamed protein product, partial [Symbiodinium pilosum]